MGLLDKELDKLTATVTREALETRAELAASFTATLRGARIDAALPRPIRPNATNYGAGGRLVGWSVRASGGEVILNLRDGDAGGDVIATVDLAAGTSQTFSGVPGVSFVDGLFVESVGVGVPVGAVWIGAAD